MRPSRVALALALLALAALLVWAAAARRSLAERAVHALAERSGLSPRELRVRELGLFSAELGPLELGEPGELHVERIVLGWTLGSLLTGSLSRVEVVDPRVRAHATEGGLRFPALASLPPGDAADEAAPAALPVERVHVTGAHLELDGDFGPLALDDVALGVVLDAERRGLEHASLELGALRDRTRPARFAPLSLRLESAGGAPIPVEGRLEALGGRVAVDLEGVVALAPVAASGGLTLAPMALGEAGVRPHELSPLLPRVDELSGRVSARAAFEVPAEGAPAVRGEAVMEDVAFTLEDGARVEGLSGTVPFAGPAPWRTRRASEVRFSLLDLIGPFTDGSVRFEASWPEVDVERAAWTWAGGTVVTGGRFDLLSERHAFTLDVEGVDLATLLAEAAIPDLSGEGRLSGAVPLVYEDGGLRAVEGELHSVGPGILRYAPAGNAAAALGMGGDVEVVVRALEEYHYESVRLSFDGRLDAEMRIGAHLDGRNPTYEKGRPVVLNLDLEANLPALLGGALVGDRVRDVLQRRLGDRVED